MGLLIGFLFLSIFFSFLCSIWEAVLLSITPSFIKRKERESPRTGQLLNRLKNDIDKPLSAILTLNTIAHTTGAIGVGVQAGKLFGSSGINIMGLQITAESIVAVLMTLAILFVSEILPKTIGANNWKSLAGFTAHSIGILMIVLKPFVWFSYLLTGFLKKDKSRSVFSKQDFSAMADIVSETGDLNQEDYILIKNVLKFDELTARDVMTPQKVMLMANENQSMKDFIAMSHIKFFSRIPIYKGTRDNITGHVLKDEILQCIVEEKGSENLATIERPISTVVDHMSLRKIFKFLKDKKQHIAIVVDEYGALVGLLTLEDIIETLLGLEIMDETDKIGDLQSLARQKWEEKAKKIGLTD